MSLRTGIFCLILSGFAALTPYSQAEEKEKPLTVMSFNIRYNNPADGPNAWPNRKDWVAEVIKNSGADVIGCQEVLKGQLEDLKERLPGFSVYGVGREDGKEKGEYVPVFYREDRLKLVKSRTFWFSETPEEPGSKSWDAAITRIATCCQFEDKATQKKLTFVNIHYDHIGFVARRNSSRLLLKEIPQFAGETPIVLLGDFNTRKETPPYDVLVVGTEELKFQEGREITKTPAQGPTSTWNGFTKIQPDAQIDWVFVSPGVTVQSYEVITEQKDGKFPSDHLPIVAKITLD